MTNFWNRRGTHETKGGYEFFRSQRTGGNSQSPTSYVFDADYLTDAAGAPVLDAAGRSIPVFVPGESLDRLLSGGRGATLNIDNNSLYVAGSLDDQQPLVGRPRRALRARQSGLDRRHRRRRQQPHRARASALAYDIQGNGSHVVHVTYGQYSGRYNEAQIGGNSPVGNPSQINLLYTGPAGQGKFRARLRSRELPELDGNRHRGPLANVVHVARSRSRR